MRPAPPEHTPASATAGPDQTTGDPALADPTPDAAFADTQGVVLQHIPYFVTPPDQMDQMLVVVAGFLLAVVVGIGLIYFNLHALPERMAHRASHTQFQLVGIMALLALFTHNSVFWVGALLLAALNVPDFLSPLNKIADALTSAAARLDPKGKRPRPPRPPGRPRPRRRSLPPRGLRPSRSRTPPRSPLPRGRTAMFELMFCSSVTILPDYLFRRYVQGKRFGREITLFSVWYELRWGLTLCVLLTVSLITLVFYFHPSSTNVTSMFRTVTILPERIGRVSEVYVDRRPRAAGWPSSTPTRSWRRPRSRPPRPSSTPPTAT